MSRDQALPTGAVAGHMTPALSPDVARAPQPLLRVSGLSVNVGRLRALSDLDLDIGAGELVAVTGEPGSGKTTLVRCLAGETDPLGGEVTLDGRAIARARGIGVVWQDLELCDNLDVASHLLLGQERRRLLISPSRFHATAASLLERLEMPIHDTTRLVGSLSGGQRQMLAVANALSHDPKMLVLDEPTTSLGVTEAAHVELLIRRARDRGAAVLLVSRDIEQIFRLADRIVVLRHGRVVAELDPRTTHPDDVAALLSGQQVDTSARRQLTRLHGLADRLVSAEPSSSLSLILATLGSALGTEKVCIHVATGPSLVCTASLGYAPEEIAAWSRLPFGPEGGPIGRAAAGGERVVEADLRSSRAWAQFGEVANSAATSSSWSIPVTGPAGVSAVITVFMPAPGTPQRDELDLLTLYAGYAASAVERDRLLDQLTSRNLVLETIREMLQTLTGPVTVGEEGLAIALQSLRRGLKADEVGLLSRVDAGTVRWRAYAGTLGTHPATMSEAMRAASRPALDVRRRDGTARSLPSSLDQRILAVPFNAPGGAAALLATLSDSRASEEETALIEDAAHSLNLALEREEAGRAHQEALALRRSRELQRGFLSRLSHELRTPLTAIRGYAESLMQTDVSWDRASERRFLQTIAAESSRIGRLVDHLLDFSAIESGVMRIQPDWCDLRLVVEAAVSCLPPDASDAVSIACDPLLPAVWGDHDRLEQVFVNLLGNALRHNVPGTQVLVTARNGAAGEVEMTVTDDGSGFPPALASAPFDSARRHRSHSAGAGLGLSIVHGIVEAHGGRIELAAAPVGTAFRILLPVEASGTEPPDGAPQEALAGVTPGTPAALPAAVPSGHDD
ncbi:MAG: ATP-binding cassette domain-containing protein [Actinomycetota bacterium]|nr:ATP-binding cassette domain-containing protein [Actinomycetota bacterium]